jgi:hypothetical protein
MNRKSLMRADNRVTALKLLAMGAALCVCSGVNAQVKLPPPPEPLKIPDLVISSLSAKLVPPNKVQYSWTITNVGAGSAKLEGPTPGSSDNVSVQAMLSKDTVFGNAGDLPAGGTIVGNSPLANLAPGASKSGTFTATVPGSITFLPHLVLKVDSRNVLSELNENNNTAAVGVAR